MLSYVIETACASDSTSVKTSRGRSSELLVCAACVVLFALWLPAAHAGEVLSRIGTVVIPSASASSPFLDFDIGVADPSIDRYLLTNVSNKSLDVFQASTGVFLLSVPGFAGGHPPGWTLNGPSGVVTVAGLDGMEAWVGDGDSTVKVVALGTGRVIDTISTGGKARVDEMCYDSRDQVLLVENADEATPFVTFISTGPGHAVLAKLSFPGATDGLEQPVWSPDTGLIYLAVPEVDRADGGLAVIDPVARKVVKTIRVEGCHPNGAALGLNEHLLLGCREQANKKSDQELSGALMLDMRTGKKIASFPTIMASDQLAFNRRDKRFYVSAYGNPSGPVLIAIDSIVPGRPPLQARTGVLAHSVAVDERTNHVLVPLRPDAADKSCLYGCVAVFAVTTSRESGMASQKISTGSNH